MILQFAFNAKVQNIHTIIKYNWLHRSPKQQKKNKKERRKKKQCENENEHKKGDLRECGRIVVCMMYDNEIWLCYPVISTIKWTIECEREIQAAVNSLLMLYMYPVSIGCNWNIFSECDQNCIVNAIVGMDVNSFVLFVGLIDWAEETMQRNGKKNVYKTVNM